jgi:hypothetical protein
MAFYPQVLEPELQEHPRRRNFPRQTLRSLSYVKLDDGNGGIVRDLTEGGMAVQAVAPLQPGNEVSLRFELLSPRVRVDARGRVAWSDSSGQGGIQFTGLIPRTRRSLRDWLFTQILSSAAITGRDSMFDPQDRELMFSAAARPAILVESTAPETMDFWETPRVSWGFFSLSAGGFAMFVDTLVLLCAILLFSISSIAVMGGVPVWPLSAALLLTTSTIFVAVYQILFSEFLCGATPGRRLAALAVLSADESEEMQRFR